MLAKFRSMIIRCSLLTWRCFVVFFAHFLFEDSLMSKGNFFCRGMFSTFTHSKNCLHINLVMHEMMQILSGIVFESVNERYFRKKSCIYLLHIRLYSCMKWPCFYVLRYNLAKRVQNMKSQTFACCSQMLM